MIRDAIGSRSRIHTLRRGLALAASRLLGLLVRDVPLTREEMDALRAGLLVVARAAARHRALRGLALRERAHARPARTHSELGRNFRGRS